MWMHTANFYVRQRCYPLAIILTLSPLLYETIHTRCAAPSRGFWSVLQGQFFLYVRNFWWVFRRAFVRVQIVAKVVFFSFVGQVSFFSFVGQNKKKLFQEGFCEVPIFGFFFGFGQEGFLQIRETPPLLVQMSKTTSFTVVAIHCCGRCRHPCSNTVDPSQHLG